MKSSIAIILFWTCPLLSHGETYGGVEFPQGPASFADLVVNYSPGSYVQPPYTTPERAIGIPQSSGTSSEIYVSLGNYGSIVLGFTDNALTTSGGEDSDLWIFEWGNGSENVDVSISVDGTNWIGVGRVQQNTQGIDIDAYTADGVVPGVLYRYVKLVDVGNDFFTGPYAGADINAVGAITTVVDKPELSIRVSEVELSWASLSNETYRLDYQSDLTSNTWTTLETISCDATTNWHDCIVGDGSIMQVFDKVPLGQPSRFYRLVVTNCVPQL